MFGYELLDFSEEDEDFDDWNDSEDEFEEDVFEDEPNEKVKKSSFFGKFLIFIIFIAVCLAGFVYYISTPQGASLRSKMPTEVLAMIPAGDKNTATDNDTVDNVSNSIDFSDSLSFDESNDFTDFSAPPMPDQEQNSVPVLDFSSMSDNADENNVQTIGFSDSSNSFESSSIMADKNNIDVNIKPANIVDLEDRIYAIEQAVLNIEKSVVTQVYVDDMHSKVIREISGLRKDINKIANKKSVRSNNNRPKGSSVVRKSNTDGYKKSSVSVKWVLKSAQPGTAWLTRKDGKGGVRKVSVGDSLSGIGKVKSIDKQDGMWVVLGSLSSVRQ